MSTVKILYSPGFGAGWSTWANNLTDEQRYRMIVHPTIVAMAEGTTPFDESTIKSVIFGPDYTGDTYLYLGGWRDIRVAELPAGTQFRIEEYDGSESIVRFNPSHYFTATPLTA